MEMPPNYKTAGILMLIAGIYNLVMGIFIFGVLALYIGVLVLSTLGLGFPLMICCLIPVPGLVFGVVEIVEGMQIMNGKRVPMAPTLSIVGIVIAALTMSMVPLILEVVATVMLREDSVKAWLEAGDPDEIPGGF